MTVYFKFVKWVQKSDGIPKEHNFRDEPRFGESSTKITMTSAMSESSIELETFILCYAPSSNNIHNKSLYPESCRRTISCRKISIFPINVRTGKLPTLKHQFVGLYT